MFRNQPKEIRENEKFCLRLIARSSDDDHEELLRSRDEDDFWIYSESEINELGMGMEEIAKQMQEHDWEEDYDSDIMDDDEPINLLVCAVRRIHIND
jgi:hypothetical protein